MRVALFILILGISLAVYLLGFLFVSVWNGPYYEASDLDLNFSEQDIASMVETTADWFVFMTNDQTGLLEYEFDPITETLLNDNNDIRQLAAVWAMIELVRTVGVDDLFTPINNTLSRYLEESTCQPEYCYLNIDISELATNAFVVIDLIRLDKIENEEPIKLFANGILELQNEDGSYRPEANSSEMYGEDYYPGEAMLALMMAYETTSETKYLESVQKAFPFYRDYWTSNENTAFVPWQTQMGLLLFEVTNDPEVRDFVFDMNDWIVENEQIERSNDPSLLGAFSKDDPRITTASMLEALVDAYHLAEITGDSVRQAKYSDSIRLALNYLSNLQAENGGFAHSFSKQKQRIDYAQHAVLSLIKILEYNILEYESSL